MVYHAWRFWVCLPTWPVHHEILNSSICFWVLFFIRDFSTY
uniref:Uncharacterized protein n=1 Tax=Arundo donax TaxID=35708 RepID=A0A0A9DCB9_ARUDO